MKITRDILIEALDVCSSSDSCKECPFENMENYMVGLVCRGIQDAVVNIGEEVFDD